MYLTKVRGPQSSTSGYVCHNCRDGEKEESLKKEYVDKVRAIQVY